MAQGLAINVMGVRSRTIEQKRPMSVGVWLIIAAAVIAAAFATLGIGAYSSGMIGTTPPSDGALVAQEEAIPPTDEIIENGAVRVIKVPPGGNIEAALAKAESGDIVELQAGAIYFGEVTRPNKALTDFGTIHSSAVGNLLPDKRVGPAQRGSMATISARVAGRPAVSAANGAHHYRFVGIEFTASSAEYNYALVSFGSGEEAAAAVPHSLEIDRSYLHPFKSGVVRRGIALNSAATTIKNSYIEGFGYPGEETQGICGWSGSRNIHILNNYIEGGAENIMFGGSDPKSADLIPQDIEIRGNHLNKPPEWKEKASMKTLFELKNAKRVQFTGNLMTNCWVGTAFRVTVRNQDGGAPFSTIEDVLIKENLINGAGEGMNILGKDDTHPSQTLKRLTIQNNLFLNIGGNGFPGGGYFIQVSDGEDITIANNTVFNEGNIATFHGDLPRKFAFRDNIVSHGEYGIHGGPDTKSAAARGMFHKNIIMNLRRVGPGDYSVPGGNTMVQALKDIDFVNPVAKDFRLGPSSRFAGKGSNIPYAE